MQGTLEYYCKNQTSCVRYGNIFGFSAIQIGILNRAFESKSGCEPRYPFWLFLYGMVSDVKVMEIKCQNAAPVPQGPDESNIFNHVGVCPLEFSRHDLHLGNKLTHIRAITSRSNFACDITSKTYFLLLHFCSIY